MTHNIKITSEKPHTIDDLTITKIGGGHKILNDHTTESFAEITLHTPRTDLTTENVFRGGEIHFENYIIKIGEVT